MLFRNAMRSRKATINQAASILGTLFALTFSLAAAVGLGIAAYVVSSASMVTAIRHAGAASKAVNEVPPADFILFIIFAFVYMLWATLPLSIGGGSQFDPGRLLMYPIGLPKLFAIDLVSELTSLSSIFAVPSILAMSIGAGLATGSLAKSLVAGLLAIVVGLGLAKWLATSIGSLMKRRRTRGETLLALVGAVAGLSGAFMGQLWPVIVRHREWFQTLRWTPPGAVATAMSNGLVGDGNAIYVVSLFVLLLYAVLLIWGTYWIANRAALGKGEANRPKRTAEQTRNENYVGWELPIISADSSALIEKEARYAMRNAQLRMIALMPLILLAVRFMNTKRVARSGSFSPDSALRVHDFLYYGGGLMATGGILYVFLVLAGIACNAFAFDGGGLRTLILSPVARHKILMSKNAVIVFVCLLFSTALLIVNQLIFRDLTVQTLSFVFLSFLIFAAIMSIAGNWFSIFFPKRMKFGKRLNVSGVAGVLLLPLMLLMALPPVGATLLGYLTHSLLLEYVTLASFAAFLLLLYFPVVRLQGRWLARREREVLDAVSRDLEI
ncbi:MAG: hypothetical protein C5B44_06070 [Acidobacteria bacterium]|nr:MAG: hypothetical protein C5B44_06070 [Acidobacteriota bacterium]